MKRIEVNEMQQSQYHNETKRKTDENDTKYDSFSLFLSLHMTKCCKYKKLFLYISRRR